MSARRRASGALSPALVLVYLTSTYRGYARAWSNMKPTTVSQILEVAGKVVVGLVLAWSFTRAGKSLPVASAGAIFGVTAGGGFALIYVAIYYHRHYPEKPVADPDVPESAGHILATLLRISIPIALGSSVLSIINLVDTKLIMYRLQTALGYSESYANVLYGVYGKVQTLYNLPAAFVTPMTISIVPAIAAAVVQGKYTQSENHCGVRAAHLRGSCHADGHRPCRAVLPDRQRALSAQATRSVPRC